MVTGLNDLDRENGAQWTISELAALAEDPSYVASVDYANLHLNIDDPNISPNDKHLILVNSGNDTALQDYIQTMDANSGRSSNHNNVTAQLGDAMVSGVDRSTADERLSQDTSFAAKNASLEAREAGHHANTENPPTTVNEVKPPENTFEQGPAGPTFNMGKFV